MTGLALVAAASLGLAAPASAQTTVCAGTQSTVFVCTDPTGGDVITDCVYVVFPPCIWVTVPGPTLACGGDMVPNLECRGF